MHSHTIYEWRVGVICRFTTVGFIGANTGIDDFTSVPIPCYTVRVSNAHRRGVSRFKPSVKARLRNGLLRNDLYIFF